MTTKKKASPSRFRYWVLITFFWAVVLAAPFLVVEFRQLGAERNAGVVSRASQLFQSGDEVNAILLALETFPNPSFAEFLAPGNPEAVEFIQGAMASKLVKGQSLIGLSPDIRTQFFSPGGSYFVARAADAKVYVWDAAGELPATVFEQEAGIFHADVSPDDSLLATSYRNGDLGLWKIAGAEEVYTLSGHELPPNHLAFSPDGSLLASAAPGGILNIWDTNTGGLKFGPIESGAIIAGLSFSEDGEKLLISHSFSEEVVAQVWSVSDEGQLAVLNVVGEAFDAFARRDTLSARFDRMGNRVLTSSTDGTARLWDISTGDQLLVLNHKIEGRPRDVVAARFGLNEETIYTATEDGWVFVWEVSSGKRLESIRAHNESLVDLVLAPDLLSFFTVNQSGVLKMWDVGTGQTFALLNTGQSDVLFLEANHDGTLGAVGNARSTLLWGMRPRAELARSDGLTTYYGDAKINSAGTHIVSISRKKDAEVWAVAGAKKLGVFEDGDDELVDASVSESGARLATVSEYGNIKIWDTETVSVLEDLSDLASADRVDFIEGDSTLVLLSTTRVSLVDIDARKVLAEIPLTNGYDYLRETILSADRTKLAIKFNGRVDIVDLAAGEPVRSIKYEDFYKGLRFYIPRSELSADFSMFLLASPTYPLSTVNTVDSEEVARLPQVFEALTFVSFHPDGKRIFLGFDTQVLVADARTGALMGRWPRPPGLRNVKFSPDGRLMLDAHDGRVRLWSAETGILMGNFRGHSDFVKDYFFADGGTKIVSMSDDKTFRVWSVPQSEAKKPGETQLDGCLMARALQKSHADIEVLWSVGLSPDTGPLCEGLVELPENIRVDTRQVN